MEGTLAEEISRPSAEKSSRRLCLWCQQPLPKRRRKYCSDACADEYFTHLIRPLWWVNARQMALKRSGHRCEQCGAVQHLEAHHIVPLRPGEIRSGSPANVQSNLKVLCRACHEKAHHPLAHHPPAQHPSSVSIEIPLFAAQIANLCRGELDRLAKEWKEREL